MKSARQKKPTKPNNPISVISNPENEWVFCEKINAEILEEKQNVILDFSSEDCPAERLPNETWLLILFLCEIPDILTMILVSKHMRGLASDLLLWQNKGRHYISNLSEEQLVYFNYDDPSDYIKMFNSRLQLEKSLTQRLSSLPENQVGPSQSLFSSLKIKKTKTRSYTIFETKIPDLNAICDHLINDDANALIAATSIFSSHIEALKNRYFSIDHIREIADELKLGSPKKREIKVGYFKFIPVLIPIVINANAIQCYNTFVTIFFNVLSVHLTGKNHKELEQELNSDEQNRILSLKKLANIIFNSKNKYFIFLFIQVALNSDRFTFRQDPLVKVLINLCNQAGYLDLFIDALNKLTTSTKQYYINCIQGITKEETGFFKEILENDKTFFFPLSILTSDYYSDGILETVIEECGQKDKNKLKEIIGELNKKQINELHKKMINKEYWFEKIIFDPADKQFTLRFVRFVLIRCYYSDLVKSIIQACYQYDGFDALKSTIEKMQQLQLTRLYDAIGQEFWIANITPHFSAHFHHQYELCKSELNDLTQCIYKNEILHPTVLSSMKEKINEKMDVLLKLSTIISHENNNNLTPSLSSSRM